MGLRLCRSNRVGITSVPAAAASAASLQNLCCIIILHSALQLRHLHIGNIHDISVWVIGDTSLICDISTSNNGTRASAAASLLRLLRLCTASSARTGSNHNAVAIFRHLWGNLQVHLRHLEHQRLFLCTSDCAERTSAA